MCIFRSGCEEFNLLIDRVRCQEGCDSLPILKTRCKSAIIGMVISWEKQHKFARRGVMKTIGKMRDTHNKVESASVSFLQKAGGTGVCRIAPPLLVELEEKYAAESRDHLC